MVIIQQRDDNGKVTAEIEVNSNTRFLARCQNCGAPVAATSEIIRDFHLFYDENAKVICEKCTPYKVVFSTK